MNVSEAVSTRRSIRAFLDRPVEQATLLRVLEKSQRAPSGGNIQPWNAVMMTGEPLDRLKAAVAEVLPQGPQGRSEEFVVYPPELDGVYEERRLGVGEALYSALGIARDDKAGRLKQFARNFHAFDAPVLMLVHTPGYMGAPQWFDIGMWLQSVMLLLREEGLDSCPQESWTMYGRQMHAYGAIPRDHIFVCGLAVGYRDPQASANLFAVPRAPLSEVVRFEGF